MQIAFASLLLTAATLSLVDSTYATAEKRSAEARTEAREKCNGIWLTPAQTSGTN